MRILLFSGGFDSTALAWMERPDLALTVDYGQVAAPGEVRASAEIAKAINLEHEVLRVDCRMLGSGDLAGAEASSIAPVSEWWPFRNQLLITLGAMRAIQVGADTLIIGSVKSDDCHGDGRPEFVDRMEALMAVQEGELALRAPAIHLTAAELIKASGVPAEILGWAHSCHTGEWACGYCRGCMKQYEVRVALGYETA